MDTHNLCDPRAREKTVAEPAGKFLRACWMLPSRVHSGEAPGAPGDTPHWASAAKTGVGTALSSESLIWFTLSHGIVTEVFHSFVDTACLRGIGLVVTDRHGFVSDELHGVDSQVTYLADGVPAFCVENKCHSGRYQIKKTVFSDPLRSVLLQEICFTPLIGALEDYAVYVLAAPHLGNQGKDNTAWVATSKAHRCCLPVTPISLSR